MSRRIAADVNDETYKRFKIIKAKINAESNADALIKLMDLYNSKKK